MKTATKVVAALLFTVAVFILGYVVHRNELIPLSLRGALRDAVAHFRAQPANTTPQHRGDAFPIRPTQKQNDTSPNHEEILSIGYLQASKPAPATSGVMHNDPAHASPGLNLYTSGHAPEAVLMDMKGQTLHTWHLEFEKVWSPSSRPDYVREASTHYWRRAHLYPNGDLLAIFEGIGLIKLDKDSKLLWSYRNGCHHDMFVASDGTIYVLTSEPRKLDWFSPDEVIDNGIAILDPQGNEVRRVSLLECLHNSPYATLAHHMPTRGDVMHANTLSVLDASHPELGPAFRGGNILVSFLGCDTVAIVDLDRQSVVWAMTGLWRAQHQPELLPTGNLLVFDNRGADGQSRVLEVNPITQAVLWDYPGNSGATLYSQWCGAAARLPNGNTLISETDNGRAIEVTPQREIVWEFINPNQTVQDGVTMVSALFEVLRLPQDYCAAWLDTTGKAR